MISIEKNAMPFDLKKLELIEKRITVELPADYREFLIEYNGGRPKFYDCFSIEATRDESGIKVFLGTDSRINTSTLEHTISVFFKTRVPKELLPIARNDFGNLICIGVKGEHYGRIYFWDHDTENPEYDEEPWWENITLIANSFTEFIDSLYALDLDFDTRDVIRTYQNGIKSVEPKKGLSGNLEKDIALANKILKLDQTPKDHTWRYNHGNKNIIDLLPDNLIIQPPTSNREE